MAAGLNSVRTCWAKTSMPEVLLEVKIGCLRADDDTHAFFLHYLVCHAGERSSFYPCALDISLVVQDDDGGGGGGGGGGEKNWSFMIKFL